jgi:hypothetical protein
MIHWMDYALKTRDNRSKIFSSGLPMGCNDLIPKVFL